MATSLAKYKFGDLRTIPYTAGAAIPVDTVLILGAVAGLKTSIGVAMKTMVSGTTYEGAVAVSGVFEFVAVTGSVILAGQSVNWDTSAGDIDDNAATAASGDVVQFGKAMDDCPNGDTSILIEISEPGLSEA